MFDLIKEVINSKSYKLEDMLYKINKMYVEDFITEQEKEELDNLARENADPVNSYAPILEQIDNLYIKISNLEDALGSGMSTYLDYSTHEFDADKYAEEFENNHNNELGNGTCVVE